MAAKRRLADLYAVGEKRVFDDDAGDPVAVWIQKIPPLEQKEAVDKAGAARARITMLKYKDADDDARLAMMSRAEFQGLMESTDAMIDFLSGAEVAKSRLSHESQLAAEEEWSENGYLDGLQALWSEELAQKFALNPEDEEAKKCFEELTRYTEHVDQMLEVTRKQIKRDYAGDSDVTLRNKVVDLLLEAEADDVWLNEYRKWEVFFSVRDPEDHKLRYFESRDEIDMLPIFILRELFVAINELSVERIEGKD